MNTIRAMIVDDEPLARHRIRSLLASESDIQVVAECDSGSEAVRAYVRTRPDLVFLDIQMPDLDGFTVLQLIGSTDIPEVIFVTAYDEYAVRAFEASAVDYLLKPFENARFQDALDRARTRIGQHALAPGLEALLERLGPPRYLNRLVVRADIRYRLVPVEDIDWIEVDGNYLSVHVRGEQHTWRGSLKSLEARLDPEQFVRIHRSVVVNVDRIRTVEPWNQTEFLLTLVDGTRLTSSRTYRKRVRACLGNSAGYFE